jgi:DNA-directed RNA polymerase specialized sigma24 family protein
MNGNDLTTSGIFNPNLRMSSLEIAELTEKDHRHVMRDIRDFIEQGAIDRSRYGQISYFDSMNREQPMYQLDFESTMLLITGYDVNRRAKVINRWAQLERGEAVPLAHSDSHAIDNLVSAVADLMVDMGKIRHAITLQDENIQLHRKYEAVLEEQIATLKEGKRKRVNRPITEEEKELIVAMVAEGMSQSEVAKKMRRSSATVSYLVSERLRAAGVEPRGTEKDERQMELFPVGALGSEEA